MDCFNQLLRSHTRQTSSIKQNKRKGCSRISLAILKLNKRLTEEKPNLEKRIFTFESLRSKLQFRFCQVSIMQLKKLAKNLSTAWKRQTPFNHGFCINQAGCTVILTNMKNLCRLWSDLCKALAIKANMESMILQIYKKSWSYL